MKENYIVQTILVLIGTVVFRQPNLTQSLIKLNLFDKYDTFSFWQTDRP